MNILHSWAPETATLRFIATQIAYCVLKNGYIIQPISFIILSKPAASYWWRIHSFSPLQWPISQWMHKAQYRHPQILYHECFLSFIYLNVASLVYFQLGWWLADERVATINHCYNHAIQFLYKFSVDNLHCSSPSSFAWSPYILDGILFSVLR